MADLLFRYDATAPTRPMSAWFAIDKCAQLHGATEDDVWDALTALLDEGIIGFAPDHLYDECADDWRDDELYYLLGNGGQNGN